MTHNYPSDLKIHVDPAAFQTFVNNYRHTFRSKYRSPVEKRDTFWITYEHLSDEEYFAREILPELWTFLGVDPTAKLRKLRETVRQSDPFQDLSTVIENYDELEFCFRHSDVLHFARHRREQAKPLVVAGPKGHQGEPFEGGDLLCTWSLLLPICSRPRVSQATPVHSVNAGDKFNTNRFLDLLLSSQHNEDVVDEAKCWSMLEEFCRSLKATASPEQLSWTEYIVGIDMDDFIFQSEESHDRIRKMLPCRAVFVEIRPTMYGHICKIWNFLASKAQNDFIVLLGDDIKLLDADWQLRIVKKFHQISNENNLPFGAACVCLNDLSFQGFPTFPVLHRWHLRHFGSLLPRQFVNQGGDPYLYELYSRFNASAFCVDCRLENTIGGDGDARYKKH